MIQFLRFRNPTAGVPLGASQERYDSKQRSWSAVAIAAILVRQLYARISRGMTDRTIPARATGETFRAIRVDELSQISRDAWICCRSNRKRPPLN